MAAAPNNRVHTPPGGYSMSDILTWSDEPNQEPPRSANVYASGADQNNGNVMTGRSSIRIIQKGVGGSHVFTTDDGQKQEPVRRRPGAESKLRDLEGSDIFQAGPVSTSSNAFASNDSQNNGNYITDRPTTRIHQPAGGVSQVTFGPEDPPQAPPADSTTPRMKALNLNTSPDKQQEYQSRRAQFSDRKVKELTGSVNIFSTPEKSPPPLESSYRTASTENNLKSHIVFGDSDDAAAGHDSENFKQVSARKVKELVGSGDSKEGSPHALSEAKKKELQGCDIFADQKPVIRDSLGGVRQPPGGTSSIALI